LKFTRFVAPRAVETPKCKSKQSIECNSASIYVTLFTQKRTNRTFNREDATFETFTTASVKFICLEIFKFYSVSFGCVGTTLGLLLYLEDGSSTFYEMDANYIRKVTVRQVFLYQQQKKICRCPPRHSDSEFLCKKAVIREYSLHIIHFKRSANTCPGKSKRYFSFPKYSERFWRQSRIQGVLSRG
jgi:hypothetical protein